ncbi:MAG: alpha/beta fold hydrolase [Alphaproteobacteria bacterium]|nr:alpha/beta fold hydrolase [Alphaproteobacteria bacterium]
MSGNVVTEEGMTRENVFYYSDGLKITAHLYRPDSWQVGDAPLPAVVCLTGYTGRKNVATIDIPRRLAREGFVALAPDYRGYGEAEGERGRHRPLEQAQNTYDAVTYLETVDGVAADRIGVYGSSFGAANAVWAAAFDPRMKVVVSAVGVHDGERWLRSVRSAYDWFNFRDQVREEARRRVVTGEQEMIYRYDIYPNDPDAVEKPKLTFEEHGAEDVTHVDMESVEACLRYKPDWVVDRISPRPVLFFAAEFDSIVPPEEVVATYEKCGEPKKLVELPGARHNHVYEFSNTEYFETVASETTAWFRHYL